MRYFFLKPNLTERCGARRGHCEVLCGTVAQISLCVAFQVLHHLRAPGLTAPGSAGRRLHATFSTPHLTHLISCLFGRNRLYQKLILFSRRVFCRSLVLTSEPCKWVNGLSVAGRQYGCFFFCCSMSPRMSELSFSSGYSVPLALLPPSHGKPFVFFPASQTRMLFQALPRGQISLAKTKRKKFPSREPC